MSQLIQTRGTAYPGQRWENFERFFRGRITATSAGATQTLYTAPSDTGISGSKNQLCIMRSLWISNKDTSARTLTLYIVESGGTLTDDHVVLPTISIAANTVYQMNGVEELVDNGGTIQAYADVTNKVIVRISGTVIR